MIDGIIVAAGGVGGAGVVSLLYRRASRPRPKGSPRWCIVLGAPGPIGVVVGLEMSNSGASTGLTDWRLGAILDGQYHEFQVETYEPGEVRRHPTGEAVRLRPGASIIEQTRGDFGGGIPQGYLWATTIELARTEIADPDVALVVQCRDRLGQICHIDVAGLRDAAPRGFGLIDG